MMEEIVATASPPPPLRLSSRQSLMWLDEQLHPNARYHNSVLTIAIDGPLDVRRLADAWEQTVADRDALRAVVDSQEPRQWFLEATRVPLPEVTLDDPRQLPSWIAERCVRPFGGKGFRWDAALLRLTPRRHVFYLCLHHMITDGVSMMLVAEHLAERYAGRVPKPWSSFHDYLRFEAQYQSSPKAARDRAYWNQKLAPGAPPVRLYGLTRTDRSVGIERVSHDGGRERARALARLADSELFRTMSPPLSRLLVMVTGLASLLYRVSGNREILLGVPFANRTQQFSRTCGLLMEQFFLKIRIEEGDTFRSLARRVERETVEALRHGQSCISDRGVEYVTLNLLPRPSKRFADLDATVRLDPATTLGGARAGEGDFRDTFGVRIFDFVDDAFEVDFDFHRATFDEAARRRIPSHFFRVLDALVADPTVLIDSVDVAGEEERRSVLEAAREPDPVGLTVDVLEQISSQSHRRAIHLAVVGPDVTLSYSQLEACSNQLARRLRALGVGPESRVAIALSRGAGELVCLLATLKAGGAYVPLDPLHPVERLRIILEDAAPSVLIAERGSPFVTAIPPGTAVLTVDDLASATAGVDDSPIDERYTENQLAYILFTSGSTGRPKGVEISRGALANFLSSMARKPGLSEGDRLLAVTTTTFDIAGLELFLPLVVGATVVIADRETVLDPRSLRQRLETEPITVMQATPALWRLLLDAGWRGNGRLRIFCGGEALSPELTSRLLACGAELWNFYGPTETTIWSTVGRIEAGFGRITIGRPIDRTQVYVLDPSLHPVPIGTIGEIYVAGAGLARGYRGRLDLTSERFLPNPFGNPGERIYRTGDLGRLLEDGRFECLGRVDHQVKIRGFRVELGEIESVLRSVPGVREAVVVADFQARGDPRLFAYWVGEADRTAVLEGARSKLPQYMIPSAFVQLDSFPLTTSGKVDRRALPRAEADHRPSRQVRWPRNDTETRLAAIWSEVLGVSPLGIDQDFFSLGGTSLLVIEARARIAEELGVNLSLRTLFETPTIEAIAAQMKRSGSTADPIVVHLRRGPAGVPPLFCLVGVQLYQDLARALPDDRAVIGMHVPIRCGARQAPSIVEIARRYVELIRSQQPAGPYHLAGLCFGGIIAFEAGRQLEALGERVTLVAVFDSYLPRGIRVDRFIRLREYVEKALREPRTIAIRVKAKALRLLRAWNAVPPEQADESSDETAELPIDGPEVEVIVRGYQRALGQLGTHLMVFRSSNRPWPRWVSLSPYLGWERLAPRVSLHEVASDHMGLVRDPHVRAVVNTIAEALQEPPGAPLRSEPRATTSG